MTVTVHPYRSPFAAFLLASAIFPSYDWILHHLKGNASIQLLPLETSGGETLTLSGRCVIHRKNVSGRRVVTMIPLRSIDSFSIQPRKSGVLLVLSTSLLLSAAFAALWFLVFPLASQVLFPPSDLSSSLEVSHLSTIALVAFAGLVAYAVYSQAELVIYCQAE